MKVIKSNAASLIFLVLFIFCLIGILVHAIVNILVSLGTSDLNKYALERSPDVRDIYWVRNMSNYDNLMWFVHITDIHVSKYRAPERVEDLKEFCKFIRKEVRPPIVVASGDLTDAKTADNLGSTQSEEEWISYADVVRNHCKASFPGKPKGEMTWLDVRGNHDTFNVASDEGKDNFFNRYSVQGTVTSRRRSYRHTIDVKGTKYSFVGIDATLSPGPKRPFNFFGGLTTPALAEIDEMLEVAAKERNSAGLIVFGHFPLSTIVSPSPGIKKVIGKHNPNAYLSGHLHNLFHLVPTLHTKQPGGFLDLELSDWKENRKYRIMAFDEGHLSFTDRTFNARNKDTVILITRPLDVKYMYHDLSKALQSMQESSHIRILVFSQENIFGVVANLDDGREILEFSRVDNGPLYVAKWNAMDYRDDRRHKLVVTVKTEIKEVVETREFVLQKEALLNEDKEEFGFIQRLILMSDIYVLFQLFFCISTFSIIGPMCLFRLFHKLTIQGSISTFKSPHQNSYCRPVKMLFYQVTKSLWLISNLDRIFYPVTFTLIYVSFGPWAIGYFIDDSVGVVFSWGMIINGVWLPTYSTLVYYCWFMIPYCLMLLAGICWTVNKKHNEIINNKVAFTPTFCWYLVGNLWMVIIMVLQALHCLEVYITYGFMALFGVCGFLRLIFVYFMWSRAVSTKHEDFADANLVNMFKNDKQKS